MGRLLKNPDIAPGTLGVRLPIGYTSISDAPVDGLIRFNASNNKIEFYFAGTWNQVAKVGSVSLLVDDLTGDGSTTMFLMQKAETDPKAIAVFVGGVYQQPDNNYRVDGTRYITFDSPPPAPGVNPNKITIIHNLNSTDAA